MRSTTEERQHAPPSPPRAPGAVPDVDAPGLDQPDTAESPAARPAAPDAAGPAPAGDPTDPAAGPDGAGGNEGGDDTPAAPPGRRRRRWALVIAAALVLALVAVVVSPVSPVSPFRPGRAEHARVPLPDGGIRVTTTTAPVVTGEKLPEAGPAPVTPLTTLPPVPGAPAPAPGEAPGPGGGPAPAPPPASVPEPGPIAGAGYGLAFHDEFGGASADASVWQTAPFGGGLPPAVRDGHLTISTTEANGYAWGHVASSGPRVEDAATQYPFARAWQEGYFEARLRYSDSPWSWPAFWLFSQHKAEVWPDEECSRLTSEWDMMENGVQNGPGQRPGNHWYFTALHRNTDNNTAGGYCDTPDEQRTFSAEFPDTNLADWHTWGASWTADRMCTYLDGVELQCMDPYDTTAQPMQLIFTMQYLSRCDGCGDRPPSLEMAVDWVRVWQR